MHSLLSSLSFTPFILTLSQPLVGKLDIWIKTSSLRASLRNDLQLPMELELTQLLRMAGSRMNVCADDSTTELIPSSLGKLVSSSRFKILDELFWDVTLGGFVRGPVPFDVPSASLSIVFAAHGSSWSSDLLTDSFATLISKLPSTRTDVLTIRTPCTLVIDPRAPPIDPRMLTLEQVNTLSFLRMRLTDFQAWANSQSVPALDGSATSLLSMRKSLFTAEQHSRFSVHPFHLHWKAAIWPLGLVFQTRVPRADWVFAVHQNAESWATGFVSNQFALNHLFSQMRIPDATPEMWSIVSRNSWRLPLQKRRLMVRVHFYDMSALERAVFADLLERQPMMTSFGLVQMPDQSWSSKAALLRLLKRNGILSSDRLKHCLEGFSLQNAEELLAPTRSSCIVCTTNTCNAFLDACGHTFCDSCIVQHVNVGGTSCPVCRAEICENGWTQVRRVTSRRLADPVSFAKQDQLVNLARNLRGSLVFVAPTVDTGRQVATWIEESNATVYTPFDAPLGDCSFDHIVCTTALLPSARCVKLLHELFQKHSTDTTTLHVLVARKHGTEEDFAWVKDFSKCYSNLIEMSMYA